jgi:hypothetical protein
MAHWTQQIAEAYRALHEEVKSHTWDIPHTNAAWEGLSPQQQTHIHSLHQQTRMHPEGHLHGWPRGTGPLFQRDFSGRSNEDYRNLHKRHKQELIDAGHDETSAHKTAAGFVYGARQRAHEAGVMAHQAAMSWRIEARRGEQRKQREEQNKQREEQNKQRKAEQNISGTRQQQEYKQNSENLFHSAIHGAANSADYYRTGAAEEREQEKQFGAINIDKRHPQLSDEAKKHLGTLTDVSRGAIHTNVWGGLQSAGKEFSKDAMEHWGKTFTGTRPRDANINHPLDIIPSLLKPEHLSAALQNYSSHTGGRSQHSNPTDYLDGDDKKTQLPIDTGHSRANQFRTNIPDGTKTFHASVGHLGTLGTSRHPTDEYHNVNDMIHAHINGSLFSLHMGVGSPFKTSDNHWERPAHASESDHHSSFRKAVGAGLKHIWSIPNISDQDRSLLHRHFESQLRHHYVAAVANPKMFNEYHGNMETSRKQRKEREERRQSSGGSGDAPPPRNRGGWRHAEQPHEILGVAPSASASEVRAAYRREALKHHPDTGGDINKFNKANDANAHMMSKLNEWIVMITEWVSKRYKK